MKSLILNTLKYSFGSPVIVSGQGLQAVGKGTVALGLAVNTAGVATEEKGREVKGYFGSKADVAAAESDAKSHTANQRKLAKKAERLHAAAQAAQAKADAIMAEAEAAEQAIESVPVVKRSAKNHATMTMVPA
jgi:hypothetical protein